MATRQNNQQQMTGGVDLGGLTALLSTLSALDQQQQQAPLVAQQRELQNQLLQWQLANAPVEAQRQQEYMQAQVQQLNNQRLPAAFPYLAPEDQQVALDRAYPERVVARQEKAAADNQTRWNMVESNARQGILPEAEVMQLFGPDNLAWLKSLATPATATTSTKRPGQKVNAAVKAIPKVGPAVRGALASNVGPFVVDAFGGDPTKGTAAQPIDLSAIPNADQQNLWQQFQNWITNSSLK